MTLQVRTVMTAMERKGFVPSNRHHKMLIYRKKDGTMTNIKTRISHGERELGDFHIGSMAKQCGISKHDFNRFVECSLSQDDYEKLLFPA